MKKLKHRLGLDILLRESFTKSNNQIFNIDLQTEIIVTELKSTIVLNELFKEKFGIPIPS